MSAPLAKNRTFIKDITPFAGPENEQAFPWTGPAKYRRVLLVFPDYEGGYVGQLRPPAGIGYLAQALEDQHVDYDVLDMSVGGSDEALLRKLREYRPDLVGISMMSYLYYRTYELFRLIKQYDRDIVTVAGGPHISCAREAVLSECEAIDYGVVKEGEATLLDLVFGREPAETPGLIHRRGDAIVFNGERPYEKDFGVFPWPRYSKFPLGKYVTEEIGIDTSRGCPEQCSFCPVIPSIGRKYRRRSNESVLEELRYWYGRGVRQISFLDDNFTIRPDRVTELCKAIRAENFAGLELNCNNGVRADRVTPEMLQEMYAAGFRYAAFGVEGGNNRVLEIMRKGETLEEIERAIRMAIDAGLQVTLFFIVGNPGETPADIEDTKRLALKYPVFDARFYNLIPFPGTEVYDWVVENRLFIKDPRHYLNSSSLWDMEPVFETPEFTRTQRMQCLEEMRRVRKLIRYRAMKRELRRLGPLATVAARLFVNDWFQAKLMKNGALRRNLKRLYMKVTSTGGNAVSLATMRHD